MPGFGSLAMDFSHSCWWIRGGRNWLTWPPRSAHQQLMCSRILQEVESLRQQLSNYDKDKVTLQLTKQRLIHADKQLKNIEWEKEVLSQRFAKVEAERNELYNKFEASILEVQQKTGLKGMLLERKVEALNDALEKKQTQLAEVLAASNLDSPTLQSVWFVISGIV